MVSHLDDYMVLLKLKFCYVKGFVLSTSFPTRTSPYKLKAVPPCHLSPLLVYVAYFG